MKKFKKLTFLALLNTLLISAVFLGGCSSNTSPKNESTDGNGKTTITVWGMGEEGKRLGDFVKDFEKDNPDIKVKIQALPWDQAHEKLLTAVASKKGADVIQMGTTWMPEFAEAKILKDITPYVEQYPELGGDNFFDGAVETTKFDDKVVGVPWYSETRVLFYRSDLLKEIGYNEPPKTWDELYDAATKLAQRGEGKFGINDITKELITAGLLARQNSSDVINKNNEPLFNQKEFVETMEYAANLYKEGAMPNYDLQMTESQIFGGEGIVPMFYGLPWNIKQLTDEAPDIEGKWATAVLPAKKNNISFVGGSNWVVFEHTKQADAAVKFIAYMSKPETQIRWMKETNSLPSNVKAWDDEFFKNNPNYQVFGQQLETAKPLPLISKWNAVDEEYKKSIERIKLDPDKVNIQEEMDALNKKVQDILR
ncbi:sugar ABC transporter substrate-binding protein [Lederbergia ruris]|uniref:sugar ABC transporter substrate-binding protein n=1 Tax=Lederbergia ruris TaxID=217495 RepID=UPI0039A2D8DD